MRSARWSSAAIICLLMAQTAVASIIWTPTIGSDPTPPTDLYTYTKSRSTGLNLSDSEAIRSAVRDITDRAKENATDLVANVDDGLNLSATVRGAHGNVEPTATIAGVRSNLTLARSATGLSAAVLALYSEDRITLTATQQLTVVSAASDVPPSVAKAAAILIFAIIDARHYQAAALGSMGNELAPLSGNFSTLATLQRRMLFESVGNDLELHFAEEDQAVIDALNDASAAFDPTRAFLALDVIAQAIDEIQTISLDGLPAQGGADSACGTSTFYFALPDDFPERCRVLIGDATANTYYSMQAGGTDPEDDENVLVLDVGGNDIYRHRAGGGTPGNPVQVNVDLGGDDFYDRGLATRGAAQGSGLQGVGILFDRTGNDFYRAHSSPGGNVGSLFQGSALAGAGALFDNAGNDLYVALDQGYSSTPHSAHAQGVASIGVGILRDLAGSDAYFFNVTNGPRHIAGTGAQAFAAGPGSAAYLLDFGQGDDHFSAGQDAVQGAAALHGLALLHDDGGDNEFQIVSALGCLKLHGEVCSENPVNYVPIGGWGQGYANTNGTSFLVTGGGDDTFKVIKLTGFGAGYQARSVLAAANTSAVAVVVDLGGEDQYDADGEAIAYGDAGVAIFTDTDDTDQYLCPVITCYGYGTADGRGIFRDHGSEGDAFADGVDHTNPLAKSNLGLGVQET